VVLGRGGLLRGCVLDGVEYVVTIKVEHVIVSHLFSL
jgi:hypothetical protein